MERATKEILELEAKLRALKAEASHKNNERKNGRGNALLNHLLATLKLKNDAALARKLKVAPPVISKLRYNTLPIGPAFILRVHEYGGMEVSAIRSMLEG